MSNRTLLLPCSPKWKAERGACLPLSGVRPLRFDTMAVPIIFELNFTCSIHIRVDVWNKGGSRAGVWQWPSDSFFMQEISYHNFLLQQILPFDVLCPAAPHWIHPWSETMLKLWMVWNSNLMLLLNIWHDCVLLVLAWSLAGSWNPWFDRKRTCRTQRR